LHEDVWVPLDKIAREKHFTGTLGRPKKKTNHQDVRIDVNENEARIEKEAVDKSKAQAEYNDITDGKKQKKQKQKPCIIM